MTYAPNEPGSFNPGVKGNATAVGRAMTNHNEVYDAYSPLVAGGAAPAYTTSATYVTVYRVRIPANYDNQPLQMFVAYQSDAGETTTIRLSYDGGTDTATTTSSSTTTAVLSATPSGTAGATREATLEVKITNGAQATVLGCYCYVQGTAGTGVLDSGWAPTNAEFYTADAPVPSERAQRMVEGPVQIAQDRRAGLVTLLDDVQATSARARYYTTSSELVARFACPLSSQQSRRYYVMAYLDNDGTGTPSADINVGPWSVSHSGTGWHVDRIYAGAAGLTLGQVTLTQTGGGAGFLRTLQIVRAP